MKIAIIGGGMTGLGAGYRLSQNGHRVTIFEKEKAVGGLARGFKEKNWQWSIEAYPHHFFTSDLTAKEIINDLGLGDQFFFSRPKTAVFLNNQVFQFDSPLSILAAPFFSLPEKIRAGVVTACLKLISDGKDLENIAAEKWLTRFYGQKIYQSLWEPLLVGKFGQKATQIAMNWFWARIKSRGVTLGYLQGGLQTLTKKLAGQIQKNKGQIILNHEVKNLDKISSEFARIIITVPTAVFLKITPQLPRQYQKELAKLSMIGALAFVLILKKPFLKNGPYWLNICAKNFPFVFIDEHTNFVDQSFYGNQHLLYVGGYYPQNHRYFKIEKETILKEFLPFLKKINPGFDFATNLLNFRLSRDIYAQPIVGLNHSQIIPPHQTPLPGIYLANMQQIYPWDRGVNYSLKLGEEISQIISQDEN